MQQPHGAVKRSTLDELLGQFERLSPEARQRDVARANAVLQAKGIRCLRDLDQLDENDVTE
jgi:hypothetical protein